MACMAVPFLLKIEVLVLIVGQMPGYLLSPISR